MKQLWRLNARLKSRPRKNVNARSRKRAEKRRRKLNVVANKRSNNVLLKRKPSANVKRKKKSCACEKCRLLRNVKLRKSVTNSSSAMETLKRTSPPCSKMMTIRTEE